MSTETLLANGVLVDGTGERPADLLIRDGVVAATGTIPLAGPEVTRSTIDISGLTVLPGIIDPHVHLREMGDSDREDFFSGTGAAAVGGITTMLDMPNGNPNVIDAESFRARCQRLQERAYVDVGFYLWACERNLDELSSLAKLGPVGFKVFTAESGAYAPEFRKYVTDDSSVMCRIMEVGAATGIPVCVHAEDWSLVRLYEDRFKVSRTDIDAYLESRPQVVEDLAVFAAVRIAEHIGAHVHVCHVSGGRAAEIVAWSRGYYPHITSETPIHNLLFDDADIRRFGSLGKYSPPVRLATDRVRLWSALLEGTIDFIGSDHAPQFPAKKQLPNAWEASPGGPWLDIELPTMLDQVSQGKLTLPQLVQVMCERPAQVFGLYPRKGSLSVGADADLVVINKSIERTVDPQRFISKAKYSPLAGTVLKGWPVMTFLRGEMIARNGELLAQPGTGRLIRSRQSGE